MIIFVTFAELDIRGYDDWLTFSKDFHHECLRIFQLRIDFNECESQSACANRKLCVIDLIHIFHAETSDGAGVIGSLNETGEKKKSKLKSIRFVMGGGITIIILCKYLESFCYKRRSSNGLNNTDGPIKAQCTVG